MINFNEIIGPIELAIVSWIKDYSLTCPVNSLEDLTNAEFFIYFLSKVPYFQFVQPCTYSNFSSLSLGQRISRMKLIGRSIITYYKREVMKDFEETHFSYVQMCTHNKEELMRLIIMFMGIIVTSSEILQQLQNFINSSQQERSEYMRIMVDYAKKMTQKDQQKSDSPIKQQKRLITKLEILQEQVQFYEEYTRQLQEKTDKIKQEAERDQKDILQNKTKTSQMLKRIEQLEGSNEELIRELGKKTSNQQLLNAKLAKNRQLTDQTINKLIQDIQDEKQITTYYKKLAQKYENVDAMNKQMIKINNELEKEISNIKGENQKNTQFLHKRETEIQNFKKINNELLLQNDNLKVKIDMLQKSFVNNRYIQFSPQQKQMVIHNPLSLSSVSNQNNFAWYNFKDRQFQMSNQQRMNDSLTLTLKSNQSFCQDRSIIMKNIGNKQNEMNIGNVSSMPQSKGNLNKKAEQKSFEIDMSQAQTLIRMKQQRDFQFQFSIQMIAEIYQQMEGLRKQLKKYQQKEAKKQQRTLNFKQRVHNMFA